MKHNLSEYMEFATRIAHEAGDIMLGYFNQSDITTIKDDNSLVTIADTAVNSYLIEQVKKYYPTHGILGEEESHNPGSAIVWVCDPIDGTSNFSRGIPMFAFSLALMIDGAVVLAVAYDPILKNLYTAIKGQGATKNGEKLITKKRPLSDPRAYAGNANTAASASFHAEMRKHLPTTRYNSYGAIVPELMQVAEGGTVFWADNFPWREKYFIDIAAAQLIVAEAGGRVTDFAGNEIPPRTAAVGFVASNDLVHDEVLRACQRAQQKLEGGK
ncbi:MAG: inositol monophosphatase [Firmicutes bacterium]|nr:inositol monophosphatase [Bacillota bacterium]